MKDDIIWRQIYIERYKNGVQSDVLSVYEAMYDEARQELSRISRAIKAGTSKAYWTESRFRILTEQLTEIIETGYVTMDKTLVSSSDELAATEIEWIGGKMAADVGATVTVHLPTLGMVHTAIRERPFSGWVTNQGNLQYVSRSPLRKVRDWQIRQMENTISRLWLEGRTTRDIEKRLALIDAAIAQVDQNYTIGRRNISAETRTSLQQYAGQAREETYRANEDLFPWVEYTATLDHRTTVICGTLDGRTFRVSDPNKPHIPQHWQCRSAWVPKQTRGEELDVARPQVTPGEDYETGDNTTRTGRVRKPRKSTEHLLKRGQAKPGTKFDDWLKAQDKKNPDFVRDYFKSDKRYQQWKDGKLGRIRYTNADGRTFGVNALSAPEKAVRKRGEVVKAKPKATPKKRVPRPRNFDKADAATKWWVKKSFSDYRQAGLIGRFAPPGFIKRHKKGAYYQPSKSAIHMGGSTRKSPRSQNTYRHEYGHYLDNELNREAGRSQTEYISGTDAALGALDVDRAAIRDNAESYLDGFRKRFPDTDVPVVNSHNLKTAMNIETNAYLERLRKVASEEDRGINDVIKDEADAYFKSKNTTAAKLYRWMKTVDWAPDNSHVDSTYNARAALELVNIDRYNYKGGVGQWVWDRFHFANKRDSETAGMFLSAADYVGAITDNLVAGGHGARYYARRRRQGKRLGNSAEAFANANDLYAVETGELGTALAEALGPEFFKFYKGFL